MVSLRWFYSQKAKTAASLALRGQFSLAANTARYGAKAARNMASVDKIPPAKVVDPDANLQAALLAFNSNTNDVDIIAKVADCYGSLGLPFKSIEYLKLVPIEDRPGHIWLRLAIASARVGDMRACTESILRIDVDTLGNARLLRLHQLRCQILSERGDFKGVLSYMGAIDGELPIELELQRLLALAALGRNEEASAGYLAVMEGRAVRAGVAKAAIQHFHRINEHATALALNTEAIRRWPNDVSLLASLARTYWSIGYTPGFIKAVKQALAHASIISGPVLNHALKARKIDPTVDVLLDKAMARIQARTETRVSYGALDFAHTACMAGRYDIARDIAERYLQGGGSAPMARYILALCKISDGENIAAFAEMKIVLQEAPYLDGAYHALYTAAATSETTVNEIAESIRSRRTGVDRFRHLDSFGRQIHQNADLIALHYITGEYESGLREKVNRRALLELSRYTPESRPFDRDIDLSQGGKSLFLIADDGVSDEVRWAQFLPQFTRRFDRVEATCEPRLLGIMQRSFPHIKFNAVNRIWGESPKRFTSTRSDIPNWEVAHYLDGPSLQKLREFEKVAFTNEMVLALVKERGTLIPAEEAGAYLVPDPVVKKHWAERISTAAGGKKRIGILWRSSVVDRKRSRYYFELESLRHLLSMTDCVLFSLQHAAKPEEIEWCRQNGIVVSDIDLFDDFEGVAAIASEMDVVVGPSTLPLEMAAAVGTPAIIPGVNFETVGIRLEKGAGAACRHSKNSFVACDPEGYANPEADQVDRLHRLMHVIADEIKSGRYGAGLSGY